MFVAITGAAASQDGGDRLAKIKEELEKTKDRLQLTDEQLGQVRPILEGSAGKRIAVLDEFGITGRGSVELSLREKRSLAKKMKEIRKNTDAELAKVLTKDQMAEYAAIQDERREELKAKMESSGGGGRRRLFGRRR